MQILICQNLRNNLQHPNEYIRGVTLRFLCRIREEEIFEPLIPSILTCLEHRHSYVRRNAVLAINSIYKLPKGEMHLQDAPDLIEKVLNSEQDLSTKRNAFLMLCNHAQDRAVHYLLSQVDNVAHWGDILQMAVLELIRKVCFEDTPTFMTKLAAHSYACVALTLGVRVQQRLLDMSLQHIVLEVYCNLSIAFPGMCCTAVLHCYKPLLE